MKKILTTLAVFVAIMAAVPSVAQNVPRLNRGVGPMMEGTVAMSQLPKDARKFIDRNFKDARVVKAELDAADSRYEVEFSDGIDLEFDLSGHWTEMDAPDGTTFSAELMKHVLPRKIYKALEKQGVQALVESVETKDYDVHRVKVNAGGRDKKYDIDSKGRIR